ncbi:MAG: hypothetical protein K2Y27_07595 [Xanthobacteraceae bacterium]|nr:hypothetical protein [Xanthobacteraceae bacterium]
MMQMMQGMMTMMQDQLQPRHDLPGSPPSASSPPGGMMMNCPMMPASAQGSMGGMMQMMQSMMRMMQGQMQPGQSPPERR